MNTENQDEIVSRELHRLAFAMSPIVAGGQYVFRYPKEFVTLPEYTARTGQVVTVLRPCTEDEADVLWDYNPESGKDEIVDRMFMVRAADGWEGEAWESELEDLSDARSPRCQRHPVSAAPDTPLLSEQGTRAEQVLARHGLSGANLEGGA